MSRKTDMDAVIDKLAKEGGVQVASQSPWQKSRTRRKWHDTRQHEKARKRRQLRPPLLKLPKGTGE